MSRPTMVYIKREMKKVLPLFALAVIYSAITYLFVYMAMKDEVSSRLLALAGYSECVGIYDLGDLFLDSLRRVMERLSLFGVIFFVFILILRLFATENRSEISDFIRILPIKEWKKIWIKAGVGEVAILGSCLLFGLTGTVLNAVFTPQIQEINEMIPDGTTNTNSCLMIWQIVLFVCLAMSAIYLILFVVQLCIHNMMLAFAVGGGILASIVYFIAMFANVYGDMGGMTGISHSLTQYLPYRSETYLEFKNQTITVYDLEWSFYADRLLFLLLLCGIGLALILLSIRCRWCIRENNFMLVNSNAVLQFIFTGISLAAGMGIALATGNAPLIGTINRDTRGEFHYWLVSIGIAAIFLFVFNLAVMLRKKKQRRG
mgnify:FL=1